jgi:hypothetical protein
VPDEGGWRGTAAGRVQKGSAAFALGRKGGAAAAGVRKAVVDRSSASRVAMREVGTWVRVVFRRGAGLEPFQLHRVRLAGGELGYVQALFVIDDEVVRVPEDFSFVAHGAKRSVVAVLGG